MSNHVKIVFNSKHEIIEWAEKNYFGYNLKPFEFNNVQILVLLGSITSGTVSTEIRVYRKVLKDNKESWIQILIRTPLRETVDVIKSNNKLMFKTSKGENILILPYAGLK